MQNRSEPESALDAKDLARLLSNHGPALELFASQWTLEPEDCVQEAFIELARQSRRPDDMVAWLYRVVRNRALNQARSARRRKQRESDSASQRPGWFVQRADHGLDSSEVEKALQELDDSQRAVVVAKVWGELTFEQLAEAMQISRSTAHRRYGAGLAELRKKLEMQWVKT